MSEKTQNQISRLIRETFDVSQISAQVVPVNSYNQNAEPIVLKNLIILDNEDRFMFFISSPDAESYISDDGWINYEMIYKSFILDQEQIKVLDSAKVKETV